MVIIFANKLGEYDFVVLTSIAFAQAKINFGASVPDTRVEAYSPQLDLSNETRIALIGHGQIGQIQDVPAATIGDFLAANLKKKLTKLIITSCWAGAQVGNKPGTSTVEIVAEKLRHHGQGGLEIVGYNGPSIKNAQLGSFVKVVDPPQRPAAGVVQGNVLQQTGGGLSALATPLTNTMTAQGGAAALASANFYAAFINELDRQGMLLKGDDVARVSVVLD